MYPEASLVDWMPKNTTVERILMALQKTRNCSSENYLPHCPFKVLRVQKNTAEPKTYIKIQPRNCNPQDEAVFPAKKRLLDPFLVPKPPRCLKINSVHWLHNRALAQLIFYTENTVPLLQLAKKEGFYLSPELIRVATFSGNEEALRYLLKEEKLRLPASDSDEESDDCSSSMDTEGDPGWIINCSDDEEDFIDKYCNLKTSPEMESASVECTPVQDAAFGTPTLAPLPIHSNSNLPDLNANIGNISTSNVNVNNNTDHKLRLSMNGASASASGSSSSSSSSSQNRASASSSSSSLNVGYSDSTRNLNGENRGLSFSGAGLSNGAMKSSHFDQLKCAETMGSWEVNSGFPLY